MWVKNGLDSRVSTLDDSRLSQPPVPTSHPCFCPATLLPHGLRMTPDCCLTLKSVSATQCAPSATINTLGTSRVPAEFHLLFEGPQPGSGPGSPVTTASNCNNRRISFPAPRLNLRVWFNVTFTFKHGPRRGHSAGLAKVAPRSPGNLPLECLLSSGKSALFLLDPRSARLSACRPVGPEKNQGGGWLGGGAPSSPSLELLSPSTALARPLSDK